MHRNYPQEILGFTWNSCSPSHAVSSSGEQTMWTRKPEAKSEQGTPVTSDNFLQFLLWRVYPLLICCVWIYCIHFLYPSHSFVFLFTKSLTEFPWKDLNKKEENRTPLHYLSCLYIVSCPPQLFVRPWVFPVSLGYRSCSVCTVLFVQWGAGVVLFVLWSQAQLASTVIDIINTWVSVLALPLILCHLLTRHIWLFLACLGITFLIQTWKCWGRSSSSTNWHSSH